MLNLTSKDSLLKPDVEVDASTQAEPLSVLPVLLAEGLIHRFNFWFGDGMRQGMRYGDDLYELAYEFNARSRSEAFQSACELMEHEISTVITGSLTRYTVWVSLRSPAHARWRTFKTQFSNNETVSKPQQRRGAEIGVRSRSQMAQVH
ncbi:hypothetical protein H6F43_17290 [Leptolyngbya sp. FACHB-36]|uniref:hypothetical protein n=1 Tax=Leptolyngbya sp. FACHB-36 TaxID=2692808 RepID=UPI001680F18D|nr:hypothetical protein [Leptolyngbya sp. FACHB-36]MBD2021938.1 hypothetical protein [Leptolyngbya sp. FACHB-36]